MAENLANIERIMRNIRRALLSVHPDTAGQAADPDRTMRLVRMLREVQSGRIPEELARAAGPSPSPTAEAFTGQTAAPAPGPNPSDQNRASAATDPPLPEDVLSWIRKIRPKQADPDGWNEYRQGVLAMHRIHPSSWQVKYLSTLGRPDLKKEREIRANAVAMIDRAFVDARNSFQSVLDGFPSSPWRLDCQRNLVRLERMASRWTRIRLTLLEE